MQEYAKTLLLVSAICALTTLILPEKNKKLRGACEFAIALFVLSSLITPLSALRDLRLDLDDLYNATVDLPSGDYTSEAWEDMQVAVGEGIARDLSSRYGVREQDIIAVPLLSMEGNELKIKSLTLTVSGSAATLDLLAVRAYAENAYSTDCEVKTHGR